MQLSSWQQWGKAGVELNHEGAIAAPTLAQNLGITKRIEVCPAVIMQPCQLKLSVEALQVSVYLQWPFLFSMLPWSSAAPWLLPNVIGALNTKVASLKCFPH